MYPLNEFVFDCKKYDVADAEGSGVNNMQNFSDHLVGSFDSHRIVTLELFKLRQVYLCPIVRNRVRHNEDQTMRRLSG